MRAHPRTPSRRSAAPGFTLLEVVVAMAILGLSLMAIFDLNAGAVASHVYVKKLTVATLLARSKMTDLEQKLYDEGLPSDDDELNGDFSEEGWPSYKWQARILAPKTQNVSTDKVLAALMGLPATGDSISSLFSAAGAKAGAGAAAGASSGITQGLPGGGMGAGMLQGPASQLVDQITKSVREVHLNVTWKDGKRTENLELVTHVVSMGIGSDRNLPLNSTGVAGAGAPTGLPGSATGQPGLTPGTGTPTPTIPPLPPTPIAPGAIR